MTDLHLTTAIMEYQANDQIDFQDPRVNETRHDQRSQQQQNNTLIALAGNSIPTTPDCTFKTPRGRRKLQAAPKNAIKSALSQVMPADQMHPMPSAQMQTMPSAQMQTMPSAQMQTMPSAQMQTMPSAQMHPFPWEQQTGHHQYPQQNQLPNFWNLEPQTGYQPQVQMNPSPWAGQYYSNPYESNGPNWSMNPQGFYQMPQAQQANMFGYPGMNPLGWPMMPQQNPYGQISPWEDDSFLRSQQAVTPSWPNANQVYQQPPNYYPGQAAFNQLPPVWEKDIPKAISFDDMLDNSSSLWNTEDNAAAIACGTEEEKTYYDLDTPIPGFSMPAPLAPAPKKRQPKKRSPNTGVMEIKPNSWCENIQSSCNINNISESHRTFRRDNNPGTWPENIQSSCSISSNDTRRTFRSETTPAQWSDNIQPPYNNECGNSDPRRNFRRESTPATWSSNTESSPYNRSTSQEAFRNSRKENTTQASLSDDTQSQYNRTNFEMPRVFRRESTPAPWSGRIDSSSHNRHSMSDVRRTLRKESSTPAPRYDDRQSSCKRSGDNSEKPRVFRRESTPAPWANDKESFSKNRYDNTRREYCTTAPNLDERQSQYRKSSTSESSRTFRRESTPAPWSNGTESSLHNWRTNSFDTNNSLRKESTTRASSSDGRQMRYERQYQYNRTADVENTKNFEGETTPAPCWPIDSASSSYKKIDNLETLGNFSRDSTLPEPLSTDVCSKRKPTAVPRKPYQRQAKRAASPRKNNDLMSISKVVVKDGNGNISKLRDYNPEENTNNVCESNGFAYPALQMTERNSSQNNFCEPPTHSRQESDPLLVALKILETDIIKGDLMRMVGKQGEGPSNSQNIMPEPTGSDTEASLDVKFNDSYETMNKFLSEEEFSFVDLHMSR